MQSLLTTSVKAANVATKSNTKGIPKSIVKPLLFEPLIPSLRPKLRKSRSKVIPAMLRRPHHFNDFLIDNSNGFEEENLENSSSQEIVSRLKYHSPSLAYSILLNRKETGLLLLDDYHLIIKDLSQLARLRAKGMKSSSSIKILDVFVEMKRNGIKPDAFIYSCLILAMPQASFSIHESMITKINQVTMVVGRTEPLTVTNKSIRALLYSLLHLTPRWKKSTEFKTIWDDVSSLPINITQDTYLAFLEGFTSVSDQIMVEKMHDLLVRQQKNVLWTAAVYKELMKSHSKLGHWRAVKRLFEEYEEKFGYDNEEATDCLASYLPALVAFKNYKQVEIACYTAILQAFTALGDVPEVSKWAGIIKAHLALDPQIDQSVIIPVLEAMIEIGTPEDCLRAYDFLKRSRSEQVSKRNKDAGMEFSTNQMTEMFLNEDETVERFRDWNMIEVPRKVLSMLVNRLASSRDTVQIKDFFKNQVFLGLALHWARQISTSTRKLNELQSITQKQLDASKVPGQKKGIYSISELKQTMSWANRRRKRGLMLEVGEKGVYGLVYEAMIAGWRSSAIVSEDPLEMEELLRDLYEIERNLAMESACGASLIMHERNQDSE